MADKSSAKGTQRAKRQEAAARLSYLRNARFETVGFVNGKVPTVYEARELHQMNLRLMRKLRPTPTVQV